MTRTNLITGFLNSGKTTSILHLLAHKDPNEKWAVLVSEFGEVGIDGALSADSGVPLKEIPGGCMHCANGLPMQVRLNTLLRQEKPDRLSIEPTGLGHPEQLLDLSTAPVYEPWIDPRAALCTLDSRLLLNEKSASNEDFRDQLATVDIIAANKSDRTTPESEQALERWWQQNGGDRQLIHNEHGKIDSHLLDLPHRNLIELPAGAAHSHQHSAKEGLAALNLPEHQRWRRDLNSGQGYQACGWVFDIDTVFDTIGVLEWVRLVSVECVKSVLYIPEGLVRINRQGDDLYIETQNVVLPDSRIELISSSEADWNALQSALLKLRLATTT